MKIRIPLILFVLSGLCGFDRVESHVSAQNPPERVLEDANDIFSRPEFQRYKNQKPADSNFPFGQSGSSGNSGSGNGDGQGSGSRDGRGSRSGDSSEDEPNENMRDRTDSRDNREQSQSDASSYRGGSFGDFGAGMAALFKILGVVALVCMVGLILWLMIPAIFNRDRKLRDMTKGDLLTSLTDEAEGVSRNQGSLEEYLSRARNMADQQNYREAVAYLLLAAMAEITARRLVTYRIGLTHRDYYRAIRRHPELSQEYLKILKIYEPLAFGRRPAELSHYQYAYQALEAGFRETQTIS